MGQVKKYTPKTGCTKEPRELCAPAGCGFAPAPEPICYPKQQTIVQDAPKETCSLEPQRTCKHVTKLVPKLSPPRSVSMCPRRSAPGPEPTPDLSRSPLSRSGATCPLRSLASPKVLLQLKIPSQDNNMSLSLPFESIFIIDLLYHSEPRLNRQFSLVKIFGLVQFMIVSTAY